MTNATETKQIQDNYYVVIDSMGRYTDIYIVASNLKEAYGEARKMEKEIGSAYYKVQRCYSRGARASSGK